MTIHFFCCSDTHGQLPEIPSRDDVRFHGTLHAGDVYNGAELSHRDDDSAREADVGGWVDPEVAAVGDWIERAGPVYVVRGNHDLADPNRFFVRSHEVTGRVERVAESLLVAGIGWHGERHYELPGESEIERVCNDLARQLRRLANPGDSVVLLTHYPPRADDLFPVSISGTGWSHDCTRSLVEQVKPAAVVAGHIHELRGRSAILEANGSKTLLIQPSRGGQIVAIDTDQRSASLVV